MEAVLSILVLAIAALVGGAYFAWRRGLKRQAALMLVLSAVAAFNLAVWTWPDASGTAPAERELR